VFSDRARSVGFYLLAATALLVLVTRAQRLVLPDGLATQVGHNSEAFLFAILVCAEIQLLRGRLRTPELLMTMAAIGLLLIGAGLALRSADLGPTLTTLNEPILAAGYLLLYLCLPRSRTTAVLVAVGVTLGIALLFHTSFVLAQAESLVPLVLAGPAIDIVDPHLMDPEHEPDRRLQVGWMLGLLVLAIMLMPTASWARAELNGPLFGAIDYLQRAAEGYWGWLLVHFYFAFWLGSSEGDHSRRAYRPRHVTRGVLVSR
jgi:hypothetical protein